MIILFLIDPPSNMVLEKDTSLALMESACERGHTLYYLPKGGIVFDRKQLRFHVFPAIPQAVAGEPLALGKPTLLSADAIDAVFIRPDPPFDAEYLHHTWLLDRLPSSVAVVNSPNGIRTVSEKLWVTQFQALSS